MPESYFIEGDGWAVRKIDRHADYYAVAVMGQVAYPIDRDNFNDEDEARQILNTNITIQFDIGELSVTPSRESLSYNKHTKESIIRKCAEIREKAQRGIKWNNTDLFDNNFSQIFIGDIEGLIVKVYYRDGWKKAVQTDDVSKLLVDPNAAIFVDDLKRGGISRIKHHVKENTSSGRYEHGDSKYKVYRVTGTDEAITKFRELVGCDESHISKTSDLDKPVSTRSYDAEKRTSVARWNGRSYSWKKGQNWSDVDIDLNDGGYFVRIDRYELTQTHGMYPDLDTLGQVVDHLIALGYDIDKDKIYGIKNVVWNRAKFQKLVHSEGKWVDITQLAQKVANNASEEDKQVIEDRMSVRDMFGSLGIDVKEIKKVARKTATETNGLRQIVALKDYYDKQEEEKKAEDIYHLCRIYRTLPKQVDNRHKPHLEACLNKYPLIKIMAKRYYGIEEEMVEELARYVDLIERESNA